MTICDPNHSIFLQKYIVRKWQSKFTFYINNNGQKSWKCMIWSTNHSQISTKILSLANIALQDYKNTSNPHIWHSDFLFSFEISMSSQNSPMRLVPGFVGAGCKMYHNDVDMYMKTSSQPCTAPSKHISEMRCYMLNCWSFQSITFCRYFSHILEIVFKKLDR